ncbi:MAG: tetratricopeptide repeat protein [Candidatus Eremiobacterota bacterium]
MKHLAVISVIILSFFLCTGWTWVNPFKSKAQEGNELYKTGKYDEALKKYTDAQVEDPNSVALYYNMGNTFYQKKEYDRSIELYKKSAEGEKDLAENSLYNTGNACFRMNKFEEAIKYYINALKINPDDQDAKYNLEMARKKMKEQQNQDKQNQDKQNQDKQNQDKQGKQDDQDKQNQDKQNQDKQNQDKQNQDKQNQDKQNQDKQNSDDEKISEQDARMLLNALEEEEKQKRKDKNNKEGLFFGNIEKDW